MPPSLAPTTLPTNNHCHHLLLATAASTAITRLAAQRTPPTGLRHHYRWTTRALSINTPIVPSTIAMRAPAGEGGGGGFHRLASIVVPLRWSTSTLFQRISWKGIQIFFLSSSTCSYIPPSMPLHHSALMRNHTLFLNSFIQFFLRYN